MPLPTPTELDRAAGKSLKDAMHLLQRGFAEGITAIRDFPETLDALRELNRVLEEERGVEASLAFHDRQVAEAEAEALQPADAKAVAVFLDGSSTSYEALRWATKHMLRPEDHLHLVNVMPFEEYRDDADKVLQRGYDFAHHAGVAAGHLHLAALPAAAHGRSGTAGVGESVVEYVTSANIGVAVFGSRGRGGGIKGTLLSRLGMGSVSNFCVQRLPCPVLIIKQSDIDEEDEVEGEALAEELAAEEEAPVINDAGATGGN